MRLEDQIEMKTLRRLHGAQRRAGRRRDDQSVFADLLDRVVETGPRGRGAVTRGGGDGAPHERRRGESPGAIMDQHQIGRRPPSRLGFQARQNAGLTRRPAERRGAQRLGATGGKRCDGLLIESAVVGMDDDGRRAKIIGR